MVVMLLPLTFNYKLCCRAIWQVDCEIPGTVWWWHLPQLHPHGDEPGRAVVKQRDTWVHVYEDTQKEVGLDIDTHTDTILTHSSPGHQTTEYITKTHKVNKREDESHHLHLWVLVLMALYRTMICSKQRYEWTNTWHLPVSCLIMHVYHSGLGPSQNTSHRDQKRYSAGLQGLSAPQPNQTCTPKAWMQRLTPIWQDTLSSMLSFFCIWMSCFCCLWLLVLTLHASYVEYLGEWCHGHFQHCHP